MIHAVFDTNVVVSGILSPDGPPGRIVDWLIQGTVRAVFDDRIVAEYDRVLHYPRLQLPVSEINVLVDRIRRTGMHTTVTPAHAGLVLPHAGDVPFAQCALSAGVPLITGNIKHFPAAVLSPVPVLSPAEYLQVLQRQG